MNVLHYTQLDYVKILLEENREGEALNHLKDICKALEAKCIVTANMLKDAELQIPKSLIKTKPQNWIFLKETWMKLISIKGDDIFLEITDGVSIKNKFKIDGKSTTPVSTGK
jgi:hypothetical protein